MAKKQILARVKVHLLLGKSITQKQCADRFDGWRLADVCFRLRKHYGLNIQKETIYNKRTGASHARYFIPKQPNPCTTKNLATH